MNLSQIKQMWLPWAAAVCAVVYLFVSIHRNYSQGAQFWFPAAAGLLTAVIAVRYWQEHRKDR
jgi:hypothetical protein